MKRLGYLTAKLLRAFAPWTFSVTFLFSSTFAHAKPLSCKDKMRLFPEAAVVNGKEGVFFESRDAERVLFVLGTCVPKLEGVIAAQDRLVALHVQATQTSSLALSVSEGLSADQKDRADMWKMDALDTRKELRERETSVLSSPIFWFSMGALLSGAIAVGVAYGMHKAEGK